MNSPRKRRDVRRANYKKLSLIKTALSQSSAIHLQQGDLRTLGIKWSKMNLQTENELDPEPRFSTPFPADSIDKAFDKAFVDEAYDDVGPPHWPRYNPELQNRSCSALELAGTFLDYLGCRSYDWDLIMSTKWDRIGKSTKALPFRGGFYDHLAHEWGVVDILCLPDRSQPHLACVLIDFATADDRLRRSELICAVEYMMRGILLDTFDEFLVNPVFVYSISNRDARILQAHFDGSHLVIRTTQYLNFEEENEENLKLYLRWMMSEPTGPTKFVTEENRCDAVTI